MGLIPPWVYAAAGAVLLVCGFGAGWSVRDAYADAAALKAVEKADKLRETMQAKVDGKSAELEDARAPHDAAATITNTQLREIYHDRTIPADCAVPDAAVSVLDRAIDRANAEARGEPGGALPGPSASAAAAPGP